MKRTGSLGSGTTQIATRSLGEQTWEGKQVMAFAGEEITTYQDAQGRLIARVRGTTPVETWEPYSRMYDWPLFVGKGWPDRFRYRNYQRGQTFDNVEWYRKVETYEDVRTPAGTFKAFKIAQRNPYDEAVHWWSPELGIVVKSRFEHFVGSYTGPGTRETELVSYDIKR